ncbi:hypothetical protein HYDPIDRAFT_33266, partial [Hydnomerulius pinastri MD-312]
MDNLFNLDSSSLEYTNHFPFDQLMDMGAADEQPSIQIDYDPVGWYLDFDGNWRPREAHAGSPMVTVPLSPIHSPIPSTTILVETVNPQNVSYNPGGGQDLAQRLTNVGAPCWALVVLELNNLLWVRMSTSPMGDIPALSESDRNWHPEVVDVTLPVGTFEKHRLSVADEMTRTTTENIFFRDALRLSFSLACRRFREEAYLQALRIIPSSIEPPFIGIIPLPAHCTPEVRAQLRMGLTFSPEVGVRLLHQVPPATLNLEPTVFRWFGNTTLRAILQHTLYDPTFAGWYGFICDVHGFDGLPYWIPLGKATNFQVAYVISWYIYALDLHLRSYANVQGVLVNYAVLPTTLPSRERVNEVNTRVKKLEKYFNSVVDGVPGRTVEEQHEI